MTGLKPNYPLSQILKRFDSHRNMTVIYLPNTNGISQCNTTHVPYYPESIPFFILQLGRRLSLLWTLT